MNKLVFAVLLTLLTSVAWGGIQSPRKLVVAGGGGGSYQTPAYVNGASGSTDSPVGSLAAGSINATTGNAIIAHVLWYLTGGSVSSVTDTAGNTYSRAGTTYNDGDAHIDTWIAHNITGNASNVVTATYSQTVNYPRIIVEQVSGLATSSAFDKEATGTGASTSMTTSATATTSQTHEYLTAAFGAATSGSGTAGTNWTEAIDTAYDIYSEYRVVTSTGTYSASATHTGAGGGYYGVIKTFKAAAQ